MLLLTFFFICMSGRIVLTRLRLLITSVLREMGRGRPCSLRNKPQALHRTAPISSRRHRGVVDVWQFIHVGCVGGCSLLAMAALAVGWEAIRCATQAARLRDGCGSTLGDDKIGGDGIVDGDRRAPDAGNRVQWKRPIGMNTIRKLVESRIGRKISYLP